MPLFAIGAVAAAGPARRKGAGDLPALMPMLSPRQGRIICGGLAIAGATPTRRLST
jgi:hypothetical protein